MLWIIALFGLIAVPAILHWRGAAPHLILAATVAGYVVVTGVLFLSAFVDRTPPSADPRRTLHDTYYVVSQGHYMFSIALVVLFMWFVAWLLTRFDMLYFRRLTMLAFWAFHLGLVANFAVQLRFQSILKTGKVQDVADTFAMWNSVSFSAAHITTLGAMLFLALGILSLLRRAFGRA